MPSLKMFLIFCAILTVCFCDTTKKKKKHKYDLYWHGFHYLTFLAFKIKALFVIGSIFLIGIVAGKFFAILKLAEYMKKSNNDKHTEKIVYVSPHASDDHHPPIHSYPGPSSYYGKSNIDGGGYHESFPPGFSVDQPPPGAQIAGGNFNGPGQMYGGDYNSGPGQAYGPPHGYGRSDNTENPTIDEYLRKFKDAVRRFDLTDMAFNEMNLKSEKCRRKFVCEADFNCKKSYILKSAFDMFSDDNYNTYKTRKDIGSIDECSELYPNCIEDT